MSDEGGGLASLGAGWPPAQPGEEVLGLLLGDLGALPGAQPLDGDQRGEDGQHEAVPHVEDAHHLQRERLMTMFLQFIVSSKVL